MKVSVVIPTYRRPKDLERCLNALKPQTRSADEVLVIVRDSDDETQTFLKTFDAAALPLRTATVMVTGVVAAMNLGLDEATGDIIAFTDDDAAPHRDWLEKMAAHFQADERVGGVGGRDLIQRTEPWFQGTREIVGLLQWHGRLIGEHHRGIGQARQVDVLKGVNMSFRRSAIGNLRFDQRLLGTGAQVHFEVAFCLALRRQEWILIYDPAVLVDHYIAKRFDEDARDQFNAVAFSNAVHNETLVLLEHLSPIQQLVFLIWSILIGTRQAFGLAQWIRCLPEQGSIATQKWLASMHGRWHGWLTWRKTSRLRLFEEISQ